MKNILLTSLFALIATFSFAQTSQGTLSLSGNIGISISNSNTDDIDEGSKLRSYKIRPSIGYLISDNLELGLLVGYEYYNNKSHYNHTYSSGSTYTSESESKEKSYMAGTYLKKYLMLSEKIALTGSSDLLFSNQKSKGFSSSFYKDETGNGSGSGSKSNYTTNRIEIYLSPGISLFPTEKIALNASFGNIGYSHTTYTNELEPLDNLPKNGRSTNSGFNLNLGTSTFLFGLTYYISR